MMLYSFVRGDRLCDRNDFMSLSFVGDCQCKDFNMDLEA